MSRRLRILLIQPAWNGLEYRRKIKVDERAIHPLSLGVVAALSGTHEVTLLNEAQEPLPSSAQGFDVVGISVNTFNAPRAYQLGVRYRTEGVPVVFGGPQTGLMGEECLKYADAIVIGDAEDTWPRVLEDLQAGTLQARYVSQLASGAMIPAPRRGLFRRNSSQVAFCQISRGCTNKCRFCYLQYLPNRGLRLREPGAVVRELQEMPQPVILFVDDNLFCELDYTREVLEAITPLGKKWWIQAPTNLHRMDGVIERMARSGCFSVSIGFQTASNANNQDERIFQNRVEEYGALVKELRRHGILVDGTFIFGFDGDEGSTFAATGDLIRRLELDTYTFYFLTPYPGTEYFEHFKQEGRLLHQDWSRYDWDHVVVRPKRMAPEALTDGVRDLYRDLDRNYFPRVCVRHAALHWRNLGCPSLLRFLAGTGWNYWRSPILQPEDGARSAYSIIANR